MEDDVVEVKSKSKSKAKAKKPKTTTPKKKKKDAEDETFDNEAVKPNVEKRKEVIKFPGLEDDINIMHAPTYPNSIAMSPSKTILASITGSVLSLTVTPNSFFIINKRN